MIKQLYSIVLISVLFISYAYAQPAEYEHHGCHQVRNRVAGIRWTPEQIAHGRAALERSDTFDILHYDINLDVTAFAARRLKGECTVTFRTLVDDLNYINLDLEALVVDSVYFDDIKLDFIHEGTLLKINTPLVMVKGDTTAVTVFYGGIPITSASGFGGFYFENGYAYNLGIGLNDNPHNFGRAWFPCFDNFVERATYNFDLITSNGNVAYCVGTLISRDSIGEGLLSNKYVMDQPIPTYLTSVAVSNYVQRDVVHESLYGPVDIQIVARPGDINSASTSLQNLGKAVEAFEKWYGPYHWERVGYVITPRGAMEHPTNTAYPVGSVSGGTQDNRLMAHELCHHWWGNMLTLKTSHDMWIKEGNAEYGAHLYTEFAEGEEAFKAQVKTNGMRVVRRLHLDDDAGFLPLSPMPEDKTYNTHTYYKGAYVIHNMRAYLGDSLFALSQSSILENNLYGNLTAYTYRDQISQITGVDMTDYFKDWVFEAGYPTFELDGILTSPALDQFKITMDIEQKLRHKASFCNNIPVKFRFFREDKSYVEQQHMISGQSSTIETYLDFDPVLVLINADNTLNLGSLANTMEIAQTGTHNMPHGLMNFSVENVTEPAWLHVEHHFTAPDPIIFNPNGFRISANRHWKVFGFIPDDFNATATISYEKSLGSDDDLFSFSEDSLILLYRPDIYADWEEYPDYQQRKFVANDGAGQVRIFNVKAGEYALASGVSILSSTNELDNLQTIKVFPNPSSQSITIESETPVQPKSKIWIWDEAGKLVLDVPHTSDKQTLDVSKLPRGTVFMECISGDGRSTMLQKLILH
jgi:hypothetical protein